MTLANFCHFLNSTIQEEMKNDTTLINILLLILILIFLFDEYNSYVQKKEKEKSIATLLLTFFNIFDSLELAKSNGSIT